MFHQNPALFFGLLSLFSVLIAFGELFIGSLFLLLVLFLESIECSKLRVPFQLVPLGLFIAIVFFIYVQITVLYPKTVLSSGTGCVTIEKIQVKEQYKKRVIRYSLFLDEFITDNGEVAAKGISVLSSWKFPNKPLDPEYKYTVKGTLRKLGKYHYVLETKESSDWEKQQKIHTLVPLRAKLKGLFSIFLAQYFPPGHTRSFIQGIFSGEFFDDFLKMHIQRFGLQHILVVSGFHFSLIIFSMSLFFRWFFSQKPLSFLLFFFSLFYMLFVGLSASVLRAWIAASVGLLGGFFNRRSQGLNTLGVALLLLLLYDPTSCLTLSFQLSFLATGAIVLFYEPFSLLLNRIVSFRSMDTVLNMRPIDQILYAVGVFFSKAIALNLAVQVVMIPVILYHFGSVPLTGVLYNCIFSFLSVIGMFFFCFCCLCSFIPYINKILFSACSMWFDQALMILLYAPSGSEKTFLYPFSEQGILHYLGVLFVFGWFLQSREIFYRGRSLIQI